MESSAGPRFLLQADHLESFKQEIMQILDSR